MAGEILDGRLPEGNCKRKPGKEHLHTAGARETFGAWALGLRSWAWHLRPNTQDRFCIFAGATIRKDRIAA
jgi:hypothetical protein